MAALKEVISSVPEDIPVLLDAKRGDIGTTAAAYASAAFEVGQLFCVVRWAAVELETGPRFCSGVEGFGMVWSCLVWFGKVRLGLSTGYTRCPDVHV